jgi:hypothetical protein
MKEIKKGLDSERDAYIRKMVDTLNDIDGIFWEGLQ